MENQQAFEAAVAASKQLSEKPDNETLLALYSLYKQATEGDLPANAEEPGMFDFVARAKFDAWKNQQGKSQDDARNEYIRLVSDLQSR
jgi:acyl-CoA-binding protein